MPNALSRTLQVAAALALLGSLAFWVDPGVLLETLRRAHWGWVGLAALLVPLNLGLDAWVWRVLLRPIAGSVPLSRAFGAVLCGFTVGFFTPARLGEYAGRAFALDADRWTLSVSVFVQRMVDMAVAVVCGAVAAGVLLADGSFPSAPWRFVWGGGSLVGVVLLAGLLRPAWADGLARRLLPSHAAVHRRTAFLRRLTPTDICRMLGGSLLRYGVYVAQFVCLSRAFAPEASLALLGLAGGALFFVKFLVPSFTLMDLGVREGAAAFLFQAVGLSALAGLNAALLLFVLNLVLPSAVGVPFAWNLLSSRTVAAAPSPQRSEASPP